MAEKTQTRRGPLGWVKRHKKLTIFLVIVLVAALVLVNVLGKTDKAAAGSYQFVRTTVLTKTTLSDTVSVTGTVKAGSSASVTASDSVKTYKVTAVNVAVGDTVRKGDVIATLDTTDVEKQIANAQLQLSDTRTDARKNYSQAVEDQTTNLATAQENLDKAQKNYDTLGMDDYYTSMASAANSGKTNREIVTDWYTRYAEEIAGYENTLANLNIQLTQAQQDGDTARADGLQGQIADYTNRENIAKGQCSIPELGLQGFDAVSQTYNKIEQYREALEQAQQSYQNSATSASRSVDNAETKLAQSQREDDTLTNLQTALENCTLTATMDGTITALDATVGAVCSGTVATIQDVDNLTVEVTIPASSVGRLKTGLQCNITSDATDDTVTGTLTRIDPVANDSGSFGATVTVNGQDSGLLVGIPAKVEIVINTKDNVFTVPRDAVGTNDDGSTYVLRKTGGEGVDMTFEQVAVTEGDTNDYYVEITGSDLNEGDVIRATAVREVNNAGKNTTVCAEYCQEPDRGGGRAPRAAPDPDAGHPQELLHRPAERAGNSAWYRPDRLPRRVRRHRGRVRLRQVHADEHYRRAGQAHGGRVRAGRRQHPRRRRQRPGGHPQPQNRVRVPDV